MSKLPGRLRGGEIPPKGKGKANAPDEEEDLQALEWILVTPKGAG